MKTGEKPVTVSPKTSSFSAVVDEACDRLQEKQARHSLRRLHKMEENLAGLERELDEFLLKKDVQ